MTGSTAIKPIALQKESQRLNDSMSIENNSFLPIDAISYLLEVYETVFLHQFTGLTPIQKSIRCTLLKKLLIDHANSELLIRNISNFEELNDFTLTVLKRCGLIT